MGRHTAILAIVLGAEVFAGARPHAAQQSLVFRALSGTWRYESLPGGKVENCSGIAGATPAAKGQAVLTAATDGTSMRLQLSGQELQLVRQGLDPFFRTFPRPFPAKDGKDGLAYGSVEFEVRVETPDRIGGNTIWINPQGCKGTYPFRLTLLTAFEPAAVVPQAGAWSIGPSPATCAAGAIALPGLTGAGSLALNPVQSLTVTPAASPAILVLRTGPLTWNGAASVPALVAGKPVTLTGQLYLTFVEPTKAIGTLVVSSGTCAAGIQLSLVFIA